MDWITDTIAIGNYLEAQDTVLLQEHGIRSLLSLDGSVSTDRATELGLAEVISYKLIDGAGNDLRVFRFALADLQRLAARESPVLVHCHAGRSRSVAVVAAYLMTQQGLGPGRAIAAIAAKRQINITPELVDLLYELEETF